MGWGAANIVVKGTAKRSSSRARCASYRYGRRGAAVVCEKTPGAVDGGHARSDGLVQRQRGSIAVMGSRCLELLFSVLSLGLFAFSVGHLFLLLQSAMALLVQLPVAIEGAASAVEWLGIHDASSPVKRKRNPLATSTFPVYRYHGKQNRSRSGK